MGTVQVLGQSHVCLAVVVLTASTHSTCVSFWAAHCLVCTDFAEPQSLSMAVWPWKRCACLPFSERLCTRVWLALACRICLGHANLSTSICAYFACILLSKVRRIDI